MNSLNAIAIAIREYRSFPVARTVFQTYRIQRPCETIRVWMSYGGRRREPSLMARRIRMFRAYSNSVGSATNLFYRLRRPPRSRFSRLANNGRRTVIADFVVDVIYNISRRPSRRLCAFRYYYVEQFLLLLILLSYTYIYILKLN